MKQIKTKITEEDIAEAIGHAFFFTAADGVLSLYDNADIPQDSIRKLNTVTFCVLQLTNGFLVTGQSSCIDPTEFNSVTGRELALANAKEQLWELLGFRLQQQLHDADIRL